MRYLLCTALLLAACQRKETASDVPRDTMATDTTGSTSTSAMPGGTMTDTSGTATTMTTATSTSGTTATTTSGTSATTTSSTKKH